MWYGPDPDAAGRGYRRGGHSPVLGRSRVPAPVQTVVAATTGLIAVLAVLLVTAGQVVGAPLPGRASAPMHLVAVVPFLYLVGVPLSLLLNRLLVRYGPGETAVEMLAYAVIWAFVPYLAFVPGQAFVSPPVQALLGLLLGGAYYGLIRVIGGDPGLQRSATYAGGLILLGLVVSRFFGGW